MGIAVLILAGALLGWLASIILRTDTHRGIFGNIAVGILGALLTGLLVNPVIGSGNIYAGDYSAGSLIVSFLGSIALLAVVNVLRRGIMR
ncbi:MAG: GlsB/YeaQ/YmgE family stress response membrane protein [Novosphingobium sp.]